MNITLMSMAVLEEHTLLPKYACVKSADYYNKPLTLYFHLYYIIQSCIYILEYRIASTGHTQQLSHVAI